MLCQAAELERGIMCQHLFAAFSLKQSVDEGLTPAALPGSSSAEETMRRMLGAATVDAPAQRRLFAGLGRQQ